MLDVEKMTLGIKEKECVGDVIEKRGGLNTDVNVLIVR